MLIRPVETEDYPRILEIYNPYITDTLCTLEVDALTPDVFSARLDGIRKDFPFLVAEEDGRVNAYAYLSPFHERRAYRFTCDVSVYCDENYCGRGLAAALYDELEGIAAEKGFRNIVSVVTDINGRSLNFHLHRGYKEIGHFRHVAYKLGQWLGVYYLMKVLDGSDAEPFFREGTK